MNNTNVYIVEAKTKKIVRVAGRNVSERRADRITMGALMNLDRDNYYIAEDERELNEGDLI